MSFDHTRPIRRTKTSEMVTLWAFLLIAVLLGIALGGGLLYWFFGKPANMGVINNPNAELRQVTPKSEPDNSEREAIDLFANSKDSVVNVDTIVLRRGFDRKIEELQAGTGSGFFWDAEGRIVTNFHVIKDALEQRLTLRVVTADRVGHEATVVGIAPEYDLAVLKIAVDSDSKKIKVGQSSDLEVGQRVYAIGNPFGLSLTLTKGIISALDRVIESPAGREIQGSIQTDAPINPGNSGGPLLDKDGRLIGVNTSIATAQNGGGNVGIGFAIPVDTVNQVVTQLIREGKILRADLGVRLLDQWRLRRAGFSTGVMIMSVEENGPAAKAGLQGMEFNRRTGETYAGDWILKIDGAEIRSNSDFEKIISNKNPGDKVRLTIDRNEKILEVEVTLRGV